MSAIISDCGLYRYRLERKTKLLQWEDRAPRSVAFIGVNPSTADANLDDPTIRKMVGFAYRWGFESIIVGNLFNFRSTDVRGVAKAADPIGMDGNCQLIEILDDADLIIPCWGSREKLPKHLHQRIADVLKMITATGGPVKCLGTTESGDPKHPLMLGYDTPLTGFM